MPANKTKLSAMQKLKTAFVLGAGLGTRLRPLTNSLPKPMLPIRGRPLIEQIFDNLINAGIERIIINTHHAAQKYAEHFATSKYRGVELVFVHEPVLLDTGGGLKNIIPLLDAQDSILVYNGDILFSGDLKNFISQFENSSASASLMLRAEGSIKNVGVCGNYVCDMRSLLGSTVEKSMQFLGIFAISPKMLKEFATKKESIFSTVEVIVDFIRKNPNTVLAYEDNSAWTDIGTPEEYLKLQ